MDLMLKTFWFMSASIDRIQAQTDMRALTVKVSGQSQTGATGHRKRLEIEAGTIVKVGKATVMQEKPDQEGLDELRLLAQQRLGDRYK